MKFYLALLLSIISTSLHAEDYLKITEASQFFDEFRKLVLNNERELVSKSLKYPLPMSGIKVNNPNEFLENYDRIMNGPIMDLIKCSSGSDVKKMGWRGYMVSNGGIWMDGVYFGDIHPVKGSPTYIQDFRAYSEDRMNWHMRIIAMFEDGASCDAL